MISPRSFGFPIRETIRSLLIAVMAVMAVITAGSASAQQHPFEADYEVTVDTTWSAVTHPTSFPGFPHFSGLVGALHTEAATFWTPGDLASTGIELMAETGSKTFLLNEVSQAVTAGTAGSPLSGGGIGLSPGSVVLSFTADQDDPLMTLVSMLAPSPDWFIGVHDHELFDPGAGWVFRDEVVLFTYDAGTDSGPLYGSDNDDTNPKEPITLLDDFPFTPGVPVGTMTIQRVPEPTFAVQILLGSAALSAGLQRARRRSARTARLV